MNGEWATPPARLTLADGEVHVWLAHFPGARESVGQLAHVLSSDERDRAEKFHSTGHRERWQMTRGILRHLLGRYLEMVPREIAFDYGAHGKPRLKQPVNSGLHFNASHSGDYAVLAFTRAGEVGVDIERVREDLARRDDIARRFFSTSEQQQLSALPESERAPAFFTLWTRKEAVVKAYGTGLFGGPQQAEMGLVEPHFLSVSGAQRSTPDYWMTGLPPVSGYAGTVVVRAPSCIGAFWDWRHQPCSDLEGLRGDEVTRD